MKDKRTERLKAQKTKRSKFEGLNIEYLKGQIIKVSNEKHRITKRSNNHKLEWLKGRIIKNIRMIKKNRTSNSSISSKYDNGLYFCNSINPIRTTQRDKIKFDQYIKSANFQINHFLYLLYFFVPLKMFILPKKELNNKFKTCYKTISWCCNMAHENPTKKIKLKLLF